MKVFISWSGEFSQKIAALVKDWLEKCIQSIEAFVSKEDIEKGENWSARINDELANTNYGIVCLTKDNISAPWINFEAGALSKLVDSRVSTIAVDVSYSEIKGPLSSFQNTTLEKAEMQKLLRSINETISKNGGKALSEDRLTESVEAFWPSLQHGLDQIFEQHKKEPVKKTTNKVSVQQENIDELLQLARNQNAILSDPMRLFPPKFFLNVLNEINNDSRGGEIEVPILVLFERTLMMFRKLRLINPDSVELIDCIREYIEVIDGFMASLLPRNRNLYYKLKSLKSEFGEVVGMPLSRRPRRVNQLQNEL